MYLCIEIIKIVSMKKLLLVLLFLVGLLVYSQDKIGISLHKNTDKLYPSLGFGLSYCSDVNLGVSFSFGGIDSRLNDGLGISTLDIGIELSKDIGFVIIGTGLLYSRYSLDFVYLERLYSSRIDMIILPFSLGIILYERVELSCLYNLHVWDGGNWDSIGIRVGYRLKL